MDSHTVGLSPALAAYAQAKEKLGATVSEGGDPPAASFAAMLQNSLTDALDAGRKSEAATLQAVPGGANLQDVVVQMIEGPPDDRAGLVHGEISREHSPDP